MSRREKKDRSGPVGKSAMWRQAIEGHNNKPRDLKNELSPELVKAYLKATETCTM